MIGPLDRQPIRYFINGIAATGVSYVVLNICIHIAHIPSAGLSNLIAAMVGITASFLGSRYFVFARAHESIWHQLGRFWLLYAILAGVQGVVMYAWTDMAGLNYRIGFLLGTFIQMTCSYFGGKHWVFKQPN